MRRSRNFGHIEISNRGNMMLSTAQTKERIISCLTRASTRLPLSALFVLSDVPEKEAFERTLSTLIATKIVTEPEPGKFELAPLRRRAITPAIYSAEKLSELLSSRSDSGDWERNRGSVKDEYQL